MIGRSGDLRYICVLGSPLLLLRTPRPPSELLLLLLRVLRLGTICLLLLLLLLLSRRLRSPLVTRDDLAIVLLAILFSAGGEDSRCPPVAARIPRAASAVPATDLPPWSVSSRNVVLRRGRGGRSTAGSVLSPSFTVGLRPTGGGGRAEDCSYASSSFKVVTRRS